VEHATRSGLERSLDVPIVVKEIHGSTSSLRVVAEYDRADMTRFMVAVVASAILAGGGCGGDDGSKDTSGTTGAAKTNTSPTRNSGSKRDGAKKAPSAPKPDTSSASRQRSEAFGRGRDTCRSQGVTKLARRYHVRSTNPYLVAKEYALENYRPPVRPDGYEGCLLGFRASTGGPGGATGSTSPKP
jgi:hypothetical protein